MTGLRSPDDEMTRSLCPRCGAKETLQDVERAIEEVYERARAVRIGPIQPGSGLTVSGDKTLQVGPSNGNWQLGPQLPGGNLQIDPTQVIGVSEPSVTVPLIHGPSNTVMVFPTNEQDWATITADPNGLDPEIMAKIAAHETCANCGAAYDPFFRSKLKMLKEKLDETRQALLHPLEVLAYEAPDED